MNNKLKSLLIAISSTFILVAFVVYACLFLAHSNSRDNQTSAKQDEMMAFVLEWGRLAPFPTSATNVSIKTEGNIFTRSFQASFTAPKQDIRSWVEASAGINESQPEKLSDGKLKYTISPGGGASKAEVIIDYDLNQVVIYVSWS
jgi:hypothetical protein